MQNIDKLVNFSRNAIGFENDHIRSVECIVGPFDPLFFVHRTPAVAHRVIVDAFLPYMQCISCFVITSKYYTK